jgi:plasmid stabilization system protein ParE
VCALGSLPTKADGPGFAGRAEDRIDEVVMETAQRWGIETAARYNRLVFAALEAIGISPALPGSRPVSSLPDVLSFHLRSGRRLVAQEHRVRDPRHLLLADGVRRGVGAGSHGGLGRNGMWRGWGLGAAGAVGWEGIGVTLGSSDESLTRNPRVRIQVSPLQPPVSVGSPATS